MKMKSFNWRPEIKSLIRSLEAEGFNILGEHDDEYLINRISHFGHVQVEKSGVKFKIYMAYASKHRFGEIVFVFPESSFQPDVEAQMARLLK